MSIHAFHSKLMSGKEEGTLFAALRRLRGIGAPALATGEERGWSYWTDGTEGAAEEGWAVWEEGSEGMSRASA